MNGGRFPQEFRNRAKAFASRIIRLFVSLPRQSEVVAVMAKQLIRSVTSVAAHVREASRARSSDESVSKLGGPCKRPTKSSFGWNCSAKTVASPQRIPSL